MKRFGLFEKIDSVYTDIVKKIIGEIPQDENRETTLSKQTSSSVASLKQVTTSGIEKVKTVGLKKAILSIGTPKEEDVLYKEVVKREKEEEKERRKREREAKKVQKELEQAAKKAKKSAPKRKTSNAKKTTVDKKSSTTKPTVSKKASTTTNTTKKTTATKKTTTTKNTESKKTTATKKTASKKKETTSKTEKTTKSKTTPNATKKISKKVEKTKTSAKKTPVAKGTKRDAKIALYIKDIKKHYGEVDEAFVAIVVKNLGPSIYRKDAELVSCSDPKELDTVRRNFLIKKLGIDASKAVLDAAIQDVCTELKGAHTKYRATFYYALAKKFKKESVLN